jgi:hypothetical protein
MASPGSSGDKSTAHNEAVAIAVAILALQTRDPGNIHTQCAVQDQAGTTRYIDICYIKDSAMYIWEVKSKGAAPSGTVDLAMYEAMVNTQINTGTFEFKDTKITSVQEGFSVAFPPTGIVYASRNGGKIYTVNNDPTRQGVIVYDETKLRLPDITFVSVAAGAAILAALIAQARKGLGGGGSPQPGPQPEPEPAPGIRLPSFPLPGLP